MSHTGDPLLSYKLGDLQISDLVGQVLTLKFSGSIYCVACNRKIKKTFNQGYCFPCFQSLASCDMCIVKPEMCHYHIGTCRQPEWGQSHCLIEHVVYLAKTSTLKVGVTGAHKVRERWGDQGAREAVIIARVSERKLAGEIEVFLKSFVADKTDWRALLRGNVAENDLPDEVEKIQPMINEKFPKFVHEKIEYHQIKYPVISFLNKVVLLNLDKTPDYKSTLMGICGQYLIFEEAAINIRKYQGYEIEVAY